MCLANVRYGLTRILRKSALRISAEQTKRLPGAELVPQMLESHGSTNVSFCPQQSYHFTKGPELFCARLCYEIRYDLVKKRFIWPVVDHEFRKHNFGF